MKRVFIAVFALILMVSLILPVKSHSESRFKRHKLKYGISVEIPKHWVVINKNVMNQVDSNTEVITGFKHGDNETLIAANYYENNPKLSTAGFRVSIRHKVTVDMDELNSRAFRKAGINDNVDKIALELAIQKKDPSIKIGYYMSYKEYISGMISLSKAFSTSNGEAFLIHIIPLKNKQIKIASSFQFSKINRLSPTLGYMHDSLRID